ncbi:bifunctional folylpolyglutamate synthase/dihydrofolate synthase [Thermosipho atlanticus]|uniref:tetrahydrofolate synthase n=1 Tax=Thermosipho atlanticus DSM 15807 TaxID=1123380 RepID=A0A1M5R657_9BACT|nr:folylpolyglutamate synthase/dihydrofolate synthase family protein [Thermosipho atlanticus]SHH21875.1 dihydrofolate synthase / folylpolyglutamate synthase [Thermosipho atlanticus DSM 15807]
MDFIEALKYLYFQRPYGKIKLGLYRIKELLNRLGNPEKTFKSIHITGSNGKGSVTTFSHYLMVEHGYKTGGYISPHLSTILERFPINGKFTTKERFLESFKKVKLEAEKMDLKGQDYSPSFFEFATALAFQIDKDEKVDSASVEVGLGGRYDATNVINPEVSSIVTVSLEHTKILGDTIEKIAFEKAGIIKENTPLVIGNVPKKAKEVIYQVAKEKNAKVYELYRDFDFEVVSYNFNRNIINYYGENTFKNIEITLNGTHQPVNAAIAIKIFELFHKNLEESKVKLAFKNAFIPGRFELFKGFLLDGSHNPQATEKFIENINLYFKDRNKIGIVGLLDDKDKEQILSKICPLFEKIIITTPPSHRATNSFETYEIAKKYSKEVSFISDPIEALENVKSIDADLKIVVGSFYLVGYVRNYLEKGKISEEWDIMRR